MDAHAIWVRCTPPGAAGGGAGWRQSRCLPSIHGAVLADGTLLCGGMGPWLVGWVPLPLAWVSVRGVMYQQRVVCVHYGTRNWGRGLFWSIGLFGFGLMGYSPERLDHINGVKTDNRLENLREVSKEQDSQNRRCKRVINVEMQRDGVGAIGPRT